jgi:DNA recombination protein RmuC
MVGWLPKEDLVVIAALIIGLLLGAGLGAFIARRGATPASSDAAVLRAQLDAALEAKEKAEADVTAIRQRADEERRELMNVLDARFVATSQEVLDTVVRRYQEHQDEVAAARDTSLQSRLDPLKEMLGKYEAKLQTYDEEHRKALQDVRTRADELLSWQVAAANATTRLNQLLGRSDARGRWGEVQLANVLQASDLTEGIDFDLQSSGTADGGQRQRPDCILHLPNDTHIVIDAKFPFDAFEASLAAATPEEAAPYRADHAKALRSHVKALSGKNYWERLPYTPRFTVCFVPSDAALSAAFDADPSLYDYATQLGVLIAGPTNLLALLWSAKMVLQEHRQLVNAEEILKTASRLPDLIRNVVDPIAKMGKALSTATDHYNQLVSSVETRLVPAARKVQRLGVGTNAKEMPELSTVDKAPTPLAYERWGVDPANHDLALSSEVWDVDEVEFPEITEGNTGE